MSSFFYFVKSTNRMLVEDNQVNYFHKIHLWFERVISSFASALNVVVFLSFFSWSYAEAAGVPATGASNWSSNCSSCHGNAQTTAGNAFVIEAIGRIARWYVG